MSITRIIRFFLILILLFVAVGWAPAQQQVGPLMTSKWQNFQWPYNAAFPESDPDLYGVVNNHMGNACGPTAIAKLLHYHRHPEHGSGSHQFTDPDGHYVAADFEHTFYQWSEMEDVLNSSMDQETYWPVAELIFHSFVLMEDPYQTGRSLSDICRLLKKYMRYDDEMYVAYRFDYTDEAFIDLLKSEMDAGRPVLIESWTENSTPPGENGNHEGHFWNMDGYNDRGQFHVVWNVDGDADWHSFDDLGFDMSVYYMWALIGAKPDDTQKVVDLVDQDLGIYLKQHEPYTFHWSAQNVNQVNLDFSYDGENWFAIAENIEASQNSYTWEAGPDSNSKQAALRIRDVENPFYEFIFNGLEVYDQQEVIVLSPMNHDQYQVGTNLYLGWETEGVREVNIAYRELGQPDWTLLAESIPANQHFFNWDLPFSNGKAWDVRITSSDQQIIGLAENMVMRSEEQVGGPYLADSHTLLLMHGDQSLHDQVSQNLGISWEGLIPEFDYGAPGKGAGIRLDNTVKTDHNSLVIDDQPYLNLRGSFTIECWFKIHSWNLSHVNKPYLITKPINSRYNNYCLQANADDASVEFSVRTNMGTASVSSKPGMIVPGKWYHVAMIHDVEQKSLTLLLHNEQKDRIDEEQILYEEEAILQTGDRNLLIGQAYSAGDYFDGWLDELRISRIVRAFDAEWTGIKDVNLDTDLLVYPNPAHDYIRIQYSGGQWISGVVKVVDQSGRQILQISIPDTRNAIEMDISRWESGIYWVLIESNSSLESMRFVKW